MRPAITGRFGNWLFLALIAAGLAGNYFKFPIFLGLDFIFGSIFAMLALQFFGLGRGTLAAALVALSTWVLWNHPYAVIVLTAEVAVVGWLIERRKVGMVLADAIYWLVVGMPILYLSFRFLRESTPSNTNIVLVKQAVNGIANTLVARLIYTGYALRSRRSAVSYRELACNLLAFFVLFPAIFQFAIDSRSDFTETDQRIRTTLIQDNKRVDQRLETWLNNRRSSLRILAVMAASRSPQQLQPNLEQAKKSDVNYQQVALVDSDATISALFPLPAGPGSNAIGTNVADRPHVATLKRTLKPVLSEMMINRVGAPLPMVGIFVPVLVRGEYAGYVAGILGLEQIREYLDRNIDREGSFYALLDRNGNVIMTNRPDQTVMKPFARGKGTMERFGDGTSRWMPDVPPNTSFPERWKRSSYVAESTIGDQTEWKLVLEQPVAPYQKALFDSYAGKLTVLFLILLGALALAEVLGRQLAGTLERLSLMTRNLPGRLATGNGAVDWPESGMIEATRLIGNFREMADSLSAQFTEIRKINETLEERVEERTSELRENEKSLQASLREKETLLKEIHHRVKNNMAVISSLLGLQGDRIADPALRAMFDESRQRIKSMALVHEKLYAAPDLSRIDFTGYTRSLVESLMAIHHRPEREIAARIDVGDVLLDVDAAVPCGLILNELVTNALKYAFEGKERGGLTVSFSREGDAYTLTVKDDGVGLPVGFDPRNSDTLGLKIVDVLAAQLDGEVLFVSDAGTEVLVTFARHGGNLGTD